VRGRCPSEELQGTRESWENHQALQVGGYVVTVGADGSRTQSIVIVAPPAISRTRVWAPVVTSGGVSVPPPPPAPPRWVEAARQDDDVAAVLRILADPDVPWGRLSHAYEIVRSDFGSGITSWASKADCERFTHTANNRLVLGDDARHGHTGFQPPSNPMSLGEARRLLRQIVSGWLRARVPSIRLRSDRRRRAAARPQPLSDRVSRAVRP